MTNLDSNKHTRQNDEFEYLKSWLNKTDEKFRTCMMSLINITKKRTNETELSKKLLTRLYKLVKKIY